MENELQKWSIVFESIYGNKTLRVYILSTKNAIDPWTTLCDNLNSNQEFGVNYIRNFWKITKVEKINLCDGCDAGILNQLGHMDRNGCLSEDRDDPITVELQNQSLVEKYNF